MAVSDPTTHTGEVVGASAPLRLVDVASPPRAAAADAGDTPSQPATLQRMCVRIGALGLLFPFDAGREVSTPPPASRIPNTVSWLHGLANVRGTLIPVIDAAAAFGVVREPKTPLYLFILGHGETAVGLLIDGLPRLLDVDAAERLPEPPDVPALLQDGVVAAYAHGGRVWIEVDPDALFDTLAAHVALV